MQCKQKSSTTNTVDMITKGTQEYKMAQEMANAIAHASKTTKINSFMYEYNFDKLGRFINKIKDLKVFAAQIADTVEKGMNPYNYTVAKISDKQAWILACAAVENGIFL